MKMQRMSCCDTTSKILLIIFNCIFWAFGVAILIVGIWIKTDPEISNLGQAVKVGDAEPVVEIVTWLFIGAGIFVFAVGVVGMIGIIRESKIMMGFYIVCVFIVFAAEASAGVYAGVRKDYIIEKIKDEGAKFIKNSYTDDANSDYYLISKGFNYVQVQFKCCGVNDFLDYQGSVYIEELGNRIKPNASMSWACCTPDTELDDAFKNNGQLTVSADNREQCMLESVEAVNIRAAAKDSEEGKNQTVIFCKSPSVFGTKKVFRCTQGCLDSLKTWTEENMVIVLGVGIAIGVSQLILLFLALWFCQSLGAEVKA